MKYSVWIKLKPTKNNLRKKRKALNKIEPSKRQCLKKYGVQFILAQICIYELFAYRKDEDVILVIL